MVEQWDAMSTMAIQALAPVIAFLDSLAFVGHSTHIVKFPALVSHFLSTLITDSVANVCVWRRMRR